MRRRPRRRRGLAVALLVAAASACGTTIELEPFGPIADAGEKLDGTVEDEGSSADADVCPRDVDGGCLSELLADGLGEVYAIAVRSGYVYFAAFSKGYVGRVPADGGPSQTVLPDVGKAVAIALDDTHINVAVWAPKGAAGLVHASLADPVATREVRDTCPKARDVVITPRGVFGLGAGCTDESKSHLVKILPPPSLSLDSNEKEPDAPIGSLVAIAGTLYWATESVLMRTADTLDGLVLPVYDLKRRRDEGFLSLTNDSIAVYARTSKAVLRIENTPTDADVTVLATTALESVRLGIALSATDVYYASAIGKQISRVPKSGGPITSAALDDGGPLAIALDGSWLYWTNQKGELHRRRL